jgi:class 3 adenylate cyclase
MDAAYDAVMSATDASGDTVLTREELAAAASVPESEVDRLVDAGILVERETSGEPFRSVDVLRIRMVRACEEGGIPADAMSAAIREGRLSFAFTENWRLFEAAATLVPQTHAELAAEVGLSFEALRAVVTAFGFPPPRPDGMVVEAERPIATLMGRAIRLGAIDEATAVRLGSMYAEVFRRAATAENEVYHSGFEMPLLRSGLDERQSMETASDTTIELVPLLDAAVFAAYRRQQELVWTDHQIEHIEQAVESAGISLPPGPPPAISFVDLAGFTHLTEERGDEEAAAIAARLSDTVQDGSRRYRGEVVKWVGDGVMFRFRNPADAVRSALDLVRDVPAAGLPPAHIGVAAGPVIRQGGDYYGRTVNLASRISNHAGAGKVLVSAPVVDATSTPDVRFTSIGSVELAGITRPTELFEASQT